MLDYKRIINLENECNWNADVALDMRSHKERSNQKLWYMEQTWDNTNSRGLDQHRLWWFSHIQRRPPEAPVRSDILSRLDNTRRGRSRPGLTWEAVIKRDLKEYNISKELVLYMSAWNTTIYVSESLFRG
jgi:hypothetical protein